MSGKKKDVWQGCAVSPSYNCNVCIHALKLHNTATTLRSSTVGGQIYCLIKGPCIIIGLKPKVLSMVLITLYCICVCPKYKLASGTPLQPSTGPPTQHLQGYLIKVLIYVQVTSCIKEMKKRIPLYKRIPMYPRLR